MDNETQLDRKASAAAADYMACYEDLFVSLMDDPTVVTLFHVPDSVAPLNMTFGAATHHVCMTLHIDEFDLFETWDFAAALERGKHPEILAFGMVAAMRHYLFTQALNRGIGQVAFLEIIQAHHELWATRLLGLWNAERRGEKEFSVRLN